MTGFNAVRLKEMLSARKLTLQQLAEYLGISKQAVSKYQRGLSVPQAETIAKMAKILEAPFSYFGKKPLVLSPPSSILFFRTTASTPKKNIEFAAVMCRWCYEILIGLCESENLTSAKLPVFDADLSTTDKAKALRECWGLGTSPIEDLTQVLEHNGIVVTTVSDSELFTDGYSQIINGIPIIVINENRGGAVRQRFNLAHELGHLVLHRDLSETDFILQRDKIEKEAHLFANSFLLSPEGFDGTVESANWECFLEHKRKWKVSIAAMMFHCIAAKLPISEAIEKERQKLDKKFGRRFEPLDDVIPVEVPTLLSGRIKSRLRDANSFERFHSVVRLPIDFVESIAGLTKGYLAPYSDAINDEYQPFEQITLFGMDV